VSYFSLLSAETPQPLPTVALGQILVYRLELLLVCVFGALLLVTPLLQGVVNGRLPTDLCPGCAVRRGCVSSARGRRVGIAEIEETTKTTVAALVKLRGELDEVKDRNGETPGERPV